MIKSVIERIEKEIKDMEPLGLCRMTFTARAYRRIGDEERWDVVVQRSSDKMCTWGVLIHYGSIEYLWVAKSADWHPLDWFDENELS